MSLADTRRGFIAWAARLEDGAIIRAAFFAMLVGTAAVLFIDYRELGDAEVALPAAPGQPVLPAFDPDSPTAPPGPNVTTDFETLRQPLDIALGAGGVLSLTGTIDPGAAIRFAAEIEARGEYIKTIALDSPGGSVSDALAMSALIREKGFATSVAAGALCASSCPLVLAGGKKRHASAASAIGVHQIYAATTPGLPAGPDPMGDAQATTASITRHLDAMGVDPALWLHALETPPNRLYYLSPEELRTYKLITVLDPAP